jgi:hypothetical protein
MLLDLYLRIQPIVLRQVQLLSKIRHFAVLLGFRTYSQHPFNSELATHRCGGREIQSVRFKGIQN